MPHMITISQQTHREEAQSTASYAMLDKLIPLQKKQLDFFSAINKSVNRLRQGSPPTGCSKRIPGPVNMDFREKLKESEERYKNILDSIKEGYYEVDLKGSLTFFNDSLCRILGFPREKLTGMNYTGFSSEEYREDIFKTFNKVYKTGIRTEALEWNLKHRDGSVVYIEASVNRIQNADTQITGFRGIVRDITRRKNAEEALKRSEEEYRRLVENASDIIFINDRTGSCKYMNESGLKKLGYTREQIEGKNYTQLIAPEERDQHYQFYKNQLISNIPETFRDIQIITSDGRRIWISQNVKLIKNDEGSIDFYCIARDITELKKVQKELEDSEKKYRELVEEKTRDIIFTADIKGAMMTANRNIMTKLGYSERSIAAMNIREIIYDDPDDRDNINLVTFNEQIEKVTVNGCRDVRFKSVCRHRFLGEPIVLQFKLDPIIENGIISGIMGFASDPSDDPLRDYLIDSSSSFLLPNSLTLAEEMSYRLTRDVTRYSKEISQGQIRIGLREMIVNSIEHGNLEITYDEKTEAQMNDRFIDLLRERQVNPEFRDRRVYIRYSINETEVRYIISDEGGGFDHRKITAADENSANDNWLSHGRGITLALGIFDKVLYNEKGTEVTLVKKYP